MTGPDSDGWPAGPVDAATPAPPWNWQSLEVCQEIPGLLEEGADDDVLLAAASRYTIENLILNSVHEIGEWLRLGGRRLFHPHGSEPRHFDGLEGLRKDGPQGNGPVILGLQFGSPTSAAESQLNHTRDGVPIPDDSRRKRLVARLDDVGSASSCTCLPGTSISYLPAGIVITRPSGVGGLGAEWISPWSQPLLSIAEGPMPDLLEALGREIHRDVVSEEVDRICGSLYIDGGQAWSVANAGGTRIGGGGGGDAGGGDAGGNAPFATRRQSPEPIKFTLSYLDFN